MALIREININTVLSLDEILTEKGLSHLDNKHPLYPSLQLLSTVTKERLYASKEQTRKSRQILAENPAALFALLNLCHYFLVLGKGERKEVDKLLNQNARTMMVAVILKQAPKKPLNLFGNLQINKKTERREYLWKILQACAKAAGAQGLSTINGFDLWCYCKEQNHYIEEASIQIACEDLTEESFFYQCFDMFRPSSIVKSAISEPKNNENSSSGTPAPPVASAQAPSSNSQARSSSEFSESSRTRSSSETVASVSVTVVVDLEKLSQNF